MENAILPLNKDTLSKLIQKHPEGKTTSQDILLNDPLQNIHPVKFQSIHEEMIRKAAIRTKGGTGPSDTDTDGWRRILAFNNNLTREAFLSCCLIPLDKNPGLRLLGVGDVLRRIARKVVLVLKEDVIETLQVCAGQEAGIEPSAHSINMMYEDENTNAILLVDMSNAFNSLNRQSFLRKLFMSFDSNIR